MDGMNRSVNSFFSSQSNSPFSYNSREKQHSSPKIWGDVHGPGFWPKSKAKKPHANVSLNGIIRLSLRCRVIGVSFNKALNYCCSLSTAVSFGPESHRPRWHNKLFRAPLRDKTLRVAHKRLMGFYCAIEDVAFWYVSSSHDFTKGLHDMDRL